VLETAARATGSFERLVTEFVQRISRP